MSQQPLVDVCLHNLQLQLESIRNVSNLEARRLAEMALAYADDLQKLFHASSDESQVQVATDQAALGDVTNYKMYELLASYGLSRHQLLAVAQAEGLLELRKLRVLRIVYGLSLPQAQAALAEAEKSE